MDYMLFLKYVLIAIGIAFICPFALYLTFRLISKAILLSWKEVINNKHKSKEE